VQEFIFEEPAEMHKTKDFKGGIDNYPVTSMDVHVAATTEAAEARQGPPPRRHLMRWYAINPM